MWIKSRFRLNLCVQKVPKFPHKHILNILRIQNLLRIRHLPNYFGPSFWRRWLFFICQFWWSVFRSSFFSFNLHLCRTLFNFFRFLYTFFSIWYFFHYVFHYIKNHFYQFFCRIFIYTNNLICIFIHNEIIYFIFICFLF